MHRLIDPGGNLFWEVSNPGVPQPVPFSVSSPSVAHTVFPSALAEVGRILGLTWEPASELVVSLQVTDLPLVGHRVL